MEPLLCVRYILFHTLLKKKSLLDKYYFYTHFTDEETEVQKVK